MAKILINDGIHPKGLQMLRDAGHDVSTDKVEQDKLPKELPNYDAICVRSATKVRKDLIKKCKNLKVIGRGGVGLDNIDVDFATKQKIKVVNTPAASSRSVAELAFGHLLSASRFIYQSNRAMPKSGGTKFKNLKKSYSKGMELEGKNIGIIGFGRIGQETARIAMGLGMNVLAVDPYIKKAKISLLNPSIGITAEVKTVDMDLMLSNADFISLHVPFTGKAVLSTRQFNKMKPGVIITNCARGGTIDEKALLKALDKDIVAAIGLDVFENEPSPRAELLKHPRVSLTPHIGASTGEAQEKIGVELAQQLIDILK